MKRVVSNMVDLAHSYRQVGDEASAQAALQMAANLGQRYANGTAGEPEVSQLVGMAVERIALGKMDPNSPYGGDGQTVRDRMRSEEHTSELQSQSNLVCRLLLEKKKKLHDTSRL